MTLGKLTRLLKRLNPRIRIYSTDEVAISGVYLASRNMCELDHVCGITRDDPQEQTSYNSDGSIRHGGWRRVLKILIQKGEIDRWEAEKLFNTQLSYAPSRRSRQKVQGLGERVSSLLR